MATTTKVTGLRELNAALAELPKATGKAVLRRVGTAALQPFDKAWRANAAAFRLTGALEESGGVGIKLTKRQARLARKDDLDRAAVTINAGPGDPAAVQDEFGNEHQAATPFVRPAWDATKAAIPRAVGDALGSEIEAAATRIGNKQVRS